MVPGCLVGPCNTVCPAEAYEMNGSIFNIDRAAEAASTFRNTRGSRSATMGHCGRGRSRQQAMNGFGPQGS